MSSPPPPHRVLPFQTGRPVTDQQTDRLPARLLICHTRLPPNHSLPQTGVTTGTATRDQEPLSLVSLTNPDPSSDIQSGDRPLKGSSRRKRVCSGAKLLLSSIPYERKWSVRRAKSSAPSIRSPKRRRTQSRLTVTPLTTTGSSVGGCCCVVCVADDAPQRTECWAAAHFLLLVIPASVCVLSGGEGDLLLLFFFLFLASLRNKRQLETIASLDPELERQRDMSRNGITGGQRESVSGFSGQGISRERRQQPRNY